MRLVETYSSEVVAIDPLARVLHDLRGSTGDAAGFVDAEDAARLRQAMATHGLAVVPAALLEACTALARSDGTAARLRLLAWPEMEVMVQALDQALPGWREATLA